MKIGGQDIVIKNTNPTKAWGVILGVVRELWPGAITEREGADAIVYRDDAARTSWKTNGATSENADRMIQVIVHLTSVTVVVGGPEGQAAAEALRVALTA